MVLTRQQILEQNTAGAESSTSQVNDDVREHGEGNIQSMVTDMQHKMDRLEQSIKDVSAEFQNALQAMVAPGNRNQNKPARQSIQPPASNRINRCRIGKAIACKRISLNKVQNNN